jgi:hypothetical protein
MGLTVNSNKNARNGWGSRSNFQASYGLDMTVEGIAEGKEILKAFDKMDKEEKISK